MTLIDLIDSFRTLKQLDLPGRASHLKMEPEIRKRHNFPNIQEEKRKSSVLILFYDKNGQITIPYIKRSDYSGIHAKQVAFPGGKYDPKFDKSLKDTAIRECYEEIGIMPDCVEIVSVLSPIHIPVSQIDVFPYVGILKKKVEFVPNYEVDYVIEVPLISILSKENRKMKEELFDNVKFKVPYFDINDEMIWGATAMITSELVDVIHSFKSLK